jgi:hypothetical protein
MFAKMSNKLSLLLMSALIAGCGGLNSGGSSTGGSGSGKIFGGKLKPVRNDETPRTPKEIAQDSKPLNLQELLNPVNDNADIRVNKYLWESALETLSFLPIEAADPFSGILVMGWGRAPGSGTDFRATVLIQDPALEAGSLKVAMQKRNGPASAETNRRIEDAILTRARQLRIRAAKRR